MPMPVASTGYFFGGGNPRPLKGYHALPAGDPGGEAPLTVGKFHFFKRCKYFRKWIEFSKITISFFPKKSIFSKKKFEKLNIFDRIYEFFRKIIWKFSNFMKPINPEKFTWNCLISLKNLQWRRKELFEGNARATWTL